MTAAYSTPNVGSITFSAPGAGSRVIAAVVNGVATATFVVAAGTRAGTYAITATYSGAVPDLASTSAPALTVANVALTVDFIAPSNTPIGVPVPINIQVADPDPVALRMSVSFGDGSVQVLAIGPSDAFNLSHVHMAPGLHHRCYRLDEAGRPRPELYRPGCTRACEARDRDNPSGECVFVLHRPSGPARDGEGDPRIKE